MNSALSTVGVVLACDTVPGLVAKLAASWVGERVGFVVRVSLVVVLALASFWLAALVPKAALLGVIMASASSGLGEATFLHAASIVGPEAIAGWSSGTGGAGVVGASLYLVLMLIFNSTPVALCLISALPLLMIPAFWRVLLEIRSREGVDGKLLAGDEAEAREQEEEAKDTRVGMADKWAQYKALFLPYCLPLFTVYAAEYLINTAIYPVLRYSHARPDAHTQ